MKLQIINGPNLNLIGRREKSIYGVSSFDDYLDYLLNKYPQLTIDYFQSNIEGEIIDELQKHGFSYKYILLNAGGYTHTSVAIRDTIDLIESKVIEIHMTNIYAREDFRKKSLISEKCYAIFCGLGIDTYRAALYSISP